MAALSIMLMVFFRTHPGEQKVIKEYTLSDFEIFGNGLEWEMVQTCLPVFGYMFQKENQNNGYETFVSRCSPLYQYLLTQEAVAKDTENIIELALGDKMREQLLQENGKPTYTKEETDIAKQGDETQESISKKEEKVEKTERENGTTKESESEEETNTVSKRPEEMAAIFSFPNLFEPVTEKKKEYYWEEYGNPEKVREEFFAVDATTEIEDDKINPQALLEKDLTIEKGNGGPQILIYHTHSQESFADSVPGDENTSIVGAGAYLSALLKEEYGYEVLHHTGEYDVETRDYAYSYSLPNIEALLEEYPSIEVVIDLHRDAVAEGTKLVSMQNGKQAAQVMFFNGLSHTKKQGDIGYLENPYIEDNLAFSFQMQVLCNEYYPGLTRRIYLKGYRYNMHLKPKTLLVELGAQTNTCEEIKNTLDIIAHVLHMCLSGEEA